VSLSATVHPSLSHVYHTTHPSSTIAFNVTTPRRMFSRHGQPSSPTAITVPTHHRFFETLVYFLSSRPPSHLHILEPKCQQPQATFLPHTLSAACLVPELKHSSHLTRTRSQRMQRGRLRVGTNGNGMWWMRALRHRESEIYHMPFLRGCPWFIVHQSELLMVFGECLYASLIPTVADHIVSDIIALVHHALYPLEPRTT
jgi:hypothetical protein